MKLMRWFANHEAVSEPPHIPFPPPHAADPMDDPIGLTLTPAEALVLYEYLRRCDDDGKYAFVDQAEQRAIWNLECALERHMPVFSPDYGKLLQDARNELRDKEG